MNIREKIKEWKWTNGKDSNGKKMYSMWQLCLWLLFLVVATYSLSFARNYYIAKQQALLDAKTKADLNLQIASGIIDKHLSQVKISCDNLASTFLEAKDVIDENGNKYKKFVYHNHPGARSSKSEIFAGLELFTKANPHLWGAAIAFETDFYQDTCPNGLCAFVRHSSKDVYEHVDISAMGDKFREKEWYGGTKMLGRPQWTKPYLDVIGELIVSYCIPIYDENDKFLGIVDVDYQLSRFNNELTQEVHPYENSELMLLTSNQFIVHPNRNYIKDKQTSIDDLKKDCETDNKRVYFETIDSNMMTVALVCSNDDIFKNVNEITSKIRIYGSIGLIITLILLFLTIVEIKKVTESRANIESELTVASNIQMDMLPKMFPAFPDRKDINVYAALKPAKSVGGDLYDFIIRKDPQTGKESFCFIVGDVSGKGVPAALLMAMVCSLFRDIARKKQKASEIVSDINNCISDRNEHDMFCTLAVGVIDLETGKLEYCNAGHNQPIIAKGNKAEYVEITPNLPVGAFGNFEYISNEMTISPDERLFIYTDGLTEAEDIKKNEYGELAPLEIVKNHANDTPETIINNVLSGLSAFVGKAEQSDDITLMCIQLNK